MYDTSSASMLDGRGASWNPSTYVIRVDEVSALCMIIGKEEKVAG